MTEERKTTDADSVGDSLVSKIYRDSAEERAPASINERVLRQAHARAGSGYSRTVQWLRPLAWAASIGLCLAIVLELSVTPLGVPDAPEYAGFEQRSSRDDAADDQAAPRRNAPADQELGRELSEQAAEMNDVAADDVQKFIRDEQQRAESKIETFEEVPQLAADAPPPVPLSQPESQAASQLDLTANRTADSPAVGTDVGRLSAPAEAAPAVATPAVAGLTEYEAAPEPGPDSVASALVLEEIAVTSRERATEDERDRRATTTAVSGFAATAETDAMRASALCEGDAIETPESWLDCIDELEETGYEAEAREQRRLLAEAYPEFNAPGE